MQTQLQVSLIQLLWKDNDHRTRGQIYEGRTNMTAAPHKLEFSGALNQRGFWLYVWRIETPQGELLYVGRTGDSSSANAASPIKRMGQHWDAKNRGNSLFTHLGKNKISPELCEGCEMIAYGPLFPEEKNWFRHQEPKRKVAALEKKLRDALKDAGYKVMNTVNDKQDLDMELWSEVREAYAKYFPKLH